MGKPTSKLPRVDLLGILAVLQQHITGALCGAAFRSVRNRERQRLWSLEALVQFWLAVILRAPPSLSHALEEVREGREPFAPRIQASPEAFFQRCRDLSWRFFAEVFRRFVQSLLPQSAPDYCGPLAPLRQRFSDVLLIDGSRLAAIAHRLKILWNDRAVVLPGCLLVLYDLFRGIPRRLDFCADAARAEMTRAKQALQGVARGTLLVGDRLFCVGAFFEELRRRGLWGLFRRNRVMGLRRLDSKPIRRRRFGGGVLTEWLVHAGSGVSAPVQTLRLIRFKHGRKTYEALTNILDPDQLTGEEVLDLYPCRWRIERMFFDLKEVLNLNRFYPANPNAVGMQVYATAIVYAAMRVAQADAARQVGIPPEQISPAKFYPKMAAACETYAISERAVADVARLNPGLEFRRPDYHRRRFASVRLDVILVQRRSPKRRRRRYCKRRGLWKSLRHVKGGAKLL